MAQQDRMRWDSKYAGKPVPNEKRPHHWLLEHIDDLPKGRALDLATGLGHTAIELAGRGWDVTAVDISPAALAIAAETARQRGVVVNWVAADLESYPLPRERFDVVTAFYYLDRGRFPEQVVQSLRHGGMLVFETFTIEQLKVPGNHLTNPAHLLRPGELLDLFPGVRVRFYRDVLLPDRAVASLVAEKPIGDR